MYYLGVDIGGTSISVAIVDSELNIIAKKWCETDISRGGDGICMDIVLLCERIMKMCGITFVDIEHVGVACPGKINPSNGIVEYSANLGLERFNLSARLSEHIEKEVIIENDANAAAIGEYMARASEKIGSLFMITIGTGIGSGVILNGEIFNGLNCGGTEIGHMVIELGGRPCACGRRGCFERYASASGIKLTTEEKLSNNAWSGSIIWQLIGGDEKKITGKTAFDAMKKGDELGQIIVNEYMKHLACGITNVINAFSPDVVCIGGGISNEGEGLISKVRKIVNRECYKGAASCATAVEIARLRGDAGLIGAAILKR